MLRYFKASVFSFWHDFALKSNSCCRCANLLFLVAGKCIEILLFGGFWTMVFPLLVEAIKSGVRLFGCRTSVEC